MLSNFMTSAAVLTRTYVTHTFKMHTNAQIWIHSAHATTCFTASQYNIYGCNIHNSPHSVGHSLIRCTVVTRRRFNSVVARLNLTQHQHVPADVSQSVYLTCARTTTHPQTFFRHFKISATSFILFLGCLRQSCCKSQRWLPRIKTVYMFLF